MNSFFEKLKKLKKLKSNTPIEESTKNIKKIIPESRSVDSYYSDRKTTSEKLDVNNFKNEDNFSNPILHQNLFHITHIENLRGILEQGILSHELIKHNIPKRISNVDITEEIRKNKLVLDTGKPLTYFANFYFNPRNPMLFRILKQQKNIDDNNTIVVEILENILKTNYIFTDGNAASRESKFFYTTDNPEQIQIKISKIESIKYWSDSEDHKREICGECLIPELVKPEKIMKIHVIDKNTLVKVNHILLDFTHLKNIQVNVNSRMFFD